MSNPTLDCDLRRGQVGHFYMHENPSQAPSHSDRISVYRVLAVSGSSAEVELYDSNGMVRDPLENSDFSKQNGRITIDLEKCLQDIRAPGSFKVRMLSML